MKTMQDFQSWLVAEEFLAPDQKHFQEVTRLGRVRLAQVSNQTPWYIWYEEPADPSEKKQIGS